MDHVIENEYQANGCCSLGHDIQKLADISAPRLQALPGEMVMHTNRAITLKVGEWGTTFRVGGRWDVPVGTIFKLTHGQHRTDAGYGMVQAVSKMPFDQIPGSILDKCHTGNNTYQGVLAAMRRAYGESFREAQETLVLTYERIR